MNKITWRGASGIFLLAICDEIMVLFKRKAELCILRKCQPTTGLLSVSSLQAALGDSQIVCVVINPVIRLTHFQLTILMLYTAEIQWQVTSLITQTFLVRFPLISAMAPFRSHVSKDFHRPPLSSANTLFFVLKIVRPKIASARFISIFFYLIST
jgi:hypothetical protein